MASTNKLIRKMKSHAFYVGTESRQDIHYHLCQEAPLKELLTPLPEDRRGRENKNSSRHRERERGGSNCAYPYFALLKTSISSRSRLSFRDTEEVFAKTLRTTPDSAPMNTTV